MLDYYKKLKEYDKKKEFIEMLMVYIEENGEGSMVVKKFFIYWNMLSYCLDKI